MRHRPTLDSLRPARHGTPLPDLALSRRHPLSRSRQVRAVATNWASWLTVLALVSAGWRVAGAGAGATLLAAVAVAAGVTVLATGLVLSSLLWQRGLDELVRAGRTSVAVRGLQRRIERLTSRRRRSALALSLRVVAGEGPRLPHGAYRGLAPTSSPELDATLRSLLLEVAALLERTQSRVDAATVLRLERLVSNPLIALRKHSARVAQELGAIRYALSA